VFRKLQFSYIREKSPSSRDYFHVEFEMIVQEISLGFIYVVNEAMFQPIHGIIEMKEGS
jgi:hypothetical protein